MQIMFFFFEPLRFEDFVNHIEQNLHETNALRDSYLSWLINYCRKSLLFYQSQYRAHKDITWSEFCSTYEIPDYESPSNLGLDIEWRSWKEECLLESHYEEYQDTIQVLSDLQDKINSEIESNIGFSIELVPEKELDRIWFNNLINNSLQEIAELRSLNYERYLQTSHWKKIRAAMFLINKATCQANDCYVVGESWYGGTESELEVHHLSYENRGNERFDDLALLCQHHHKLIHSDHGENDTSSDNVDSNKIFTR
jgi:hypothetical protein